MTDTMTLIEFTSGETAIRHIDPQSIRQIGPLYTRGYSGRFFADIDIGKKAPLVVLALSDDYGVADILKNRKDIFKVHTLNGAVYVSAASIDPKSITALPEEKAIDVQTEFVLRGDEKANPITLEVVESPEMIRGKAEQHLSANPPANGYHWYTEKQQVALASYETGETKIRHVSPAFVRKVGEPNRQFLRYNDDFVEVDVGFEKPWIAEASSDKFAASSLIEKCTDLLKLHTERGVIHTSPSAINPLTIKELPENDDTLLKTEFSLYGISLSKKSPLPIQVMEPVKKLQKAFPGFFPR